MAPKLVITDFDFSDTSIEERLAEEAGVELVVVAGDRDPESLIEAAREADGAITSYGEWTPEVFHALPNLKVVSRSGTGYDLIDVEAATEAGVAVCTVPDYSIEVVSDHAIALAMSVLRKIPMLDKALRDGEWFYDHARPFGQSYGRTFGVIGYGNTGRAVARKAAGLGFDVLVHARSLWPGARTPEGYEIATFEDILRRSDVVSLHTPLTDETRHMIDADAIALMKDDAILVNASRGGVIDTEALAEALESGKLWGVGIDVYEEEPMDRGNPLLATPRTVLTPHTAYFSEESSVELRERTASNAIAVLLGEKPRNVLNPEVLT